MKGLGPFSLRKPHGRDVIALGNHVAQVNPDPELDPALRRGVRIPLGHPPLHLDGAAHCIHHAGELGQEAIAGALDDPAPVFGDLRLDQFPEVCSQARVRPLLIHAHQARVPRRIGGEDCGRRRVGGTIRKAHVGADEPSAAWV